MDDIKTRIETVFNSLKDLDMKPTPHNSSIMHGVYSLLKLIYQDLSEEEKGETEDV